MSKILIMGATGLLGSTLTPFLKMKGYDLLTHARKGNVDFKFDLSDKASLYKELVDLSPSVIINLVSLTSVELCEENPNLAYQTNTHSVENIVNWISENKKDTHLIQISTDHIYDGQGPFSEENVSLTNFYAFSKYAGEIAASRIKSTILRTNFFGRSLIPNRESITDWVYDAVLNRKEVEVLEDVFFNPLSMQSLSEMIALVIERKPIGIFNLGSHEGMSKADFDFAFAQDLNFPFDTMSRVKAENASFLKAYRPKDMRTDCSKFEKEMNIKLPFLKDEIRKVAKADYNEKK